MEREGGDVEGREMRKKKKEEFKSPSETITHYCIVSGYTPILGRFGLSA